jgi:hypothetical protein
MIMENIITLSQSSKNSPSVSASTILKNFVFPPLKFCNVEYKVWKEIFFDSIITEYDARRLYWYIEGRNPEHTRRLAEVLKPWLKDEIDHAYGFALIYSSYTGYPLDEIALEVETRKSEFSLIDPILQDQLRLLIMLAYDEIITTHVYHRSIKKYDNFNSRQLSSWIRKIKKDEAAHFFLFIQKAKLLFPNRIKEAPAILREIFDLDFSKSEYTGTFVLDHNTSDFPITKKEIEKMIIPAIIKKLNEKSPALIGHNQ